MSYATPCAALLVLCAFAAATVDGASVPVYQNMGVDWQYKDQDGTTLSHYDFRYYREWRRCCLEGWIFSCPGTLTSPWREVSGPQAT